MTGLHHARVMRAIYYGLPDKFIAIDVHVRAKSRFLTGLRLRHHALGRVYAAGQIAAALSRPPNLLQRQARGPKGI